MRYILNPIHHVHSLRGVCLWLCLLLPSSLSAQQEAIKWGEIPRADLEMTKFPADSNATAVILSDIGEVSFTFPGLEMAFERRRRIKILSEAGYEWGTFSIPFYAKKGYQKVADIKGQTFTLAADGSVRRATLDKKSIFDEDVDGERRRIRFTLPALAPGCVVEYRYKVLSENPVFLESWQFQTSEPTLWSEFRATIPQILEYAIVWEGLEKFDVQESEVLPLLAGAQLNLKATANRWALRNLPALREEPYMTTPDDFRAKVRFQLSRIAQRDATPIEVMNTWENLAKELMESEYFGGQIEGHKVLRQQAEALVTGLSDPEAKMRAIYDYVRTTMTWNGKYGIYTDENLDKAFKARRAGGPEIALMLTGLLRFAGLDAHPVLISTRDHGKVIDLYPLLTQFNHVVTYVRVGDREYLLDATDPLRPHILLPEPALNEIGWLVNKENPRWISIVTPGAFIHRTSVFAELAADGAISGWFQASDEGYSGLLDRRSLRDKKEDEYVRDGWLSDLTGARLDSFKISNRDSISLPLITKAYFSTSDHAQVAGDNIYLNPVFFGRLKENPFKLPERTFPVDFAYGRQRTYALSLALPEGYAVQESPKDVAIALPQQGGQFLRKVEVEGNTLRVTSHMVLRKPYFNPKEYKLLREFYDRIVAAHAEQVVLKRGGVPGSGKEGAK